MESCGEAVAGRRSDGGGNRVGAAIGRKLAGKKVKDCSLLPSESNVAAIGSGSMELWRWVRGTDLGSV